MFVELHLLQNFAPSCLNRDDTNTPKDCEFGGYRRARISSQCLKRAVRRQFKADRLLSEDDLAHRTKRLLDDLSDRLAEGGKDRQQAQAVAATALKGAGLGLGDDGKTQYLLFLGEREVQKVAELVSRHWGVLEQASKPAENGDQAAEGEGKPRKKKTGKEKKKEAKEAVPSEVKRDLAQALDGGKAADLALFGRMLADLPERNIEGACQVAHALSTNRVNMEMDYYTAVDDLKPEETTGADMIGNVGFNSSCFYRYANINLSVLQDKDHLQQDEELVNKTLEAFLRASVTAIPTGRQNNTAAQNPPSCIFVVVRERGLWSLANAFVQPARPTHTKSLVQSSVEALDAYWGKLTEVYGASDIRAAAVCLLDDADLTNLKGYKVKGVDDLVKGVLGAVRARGEQEGQG
jgi:CRISPR system Cascade subunit CasC